MKKNSKKNSLVDKLSKYEILYIVASFCVQFSYFCTKVKGIAQLTQAGTYVGLAILAFLSALTVFKNRMYKNRALAFVLLALVSATSIIITRQTGLAVILLLVISSSRISFKKIIKYDLLIKLIILAFVMSNYYMHNTQTTINYRKGVLRESFGFMHPNTLGYILMMLIAGVTLLIKESRSWRSYLLLVVTSTISLMLCSRADSRTAIYGIIALLILFVITKSNKFAGVLNRFRLLKFTPVILLLISLVSTILFAGGNPVLKDLDKQLSYRITYQNYYLEYHHITALEQDLDFEAPIDNVYFRTLYKKGVIGTVAIFVICLLAINRAQKDKEAYLLAILILLLIYGFSESSVLRMIITPYWLYASAREV